MYDTFPVMYVKCGVLELIFVSRSVSRTNKRSGESVRAATELLVLCKF